MCFTCRRRGRERLEITVGAERRGWTNGWSLHLGALHVGDKALLFRPGLEVVAGAAIGVLLAGAGGGTGLAVSRERRVLGFLFRLGIRLGGHAKVRVTDQAEYGALEAADYKAGGLPTEFYVRGADVVVAVVVTLAAQQKRCGGGQL